jgi:hypothetical protein
LNKLKCAESNEEFKVKESEFKSCHFMKQILGNFLNEDQKFFKQKMEESIRNVHEMCDELEIN